MIRIQLDGMQNPVGSPIQVSVEPFVAQVAVQAWRAVQVDAASTVIATGPAIVVGAPTPGILLRVFNSSTAGQILYLNVDAVATVADGYPLYPGDEYVWENIFFTTMRAIASAALGEARISYMQAN